MMRKLSIAVAAGVLFSSAAAFACEAHRREDRQQARIEQGVRSGELTRHEARRLERKEMKVERDIARARADGHMSRAEKIKINREENRVSRAIYNEKHDGQVR